jgi:hypothetical protein
MHYVSDQANEAFLSLFFFFLLLSLLHLIIARLPRQRVDSERQSRGHPEECWHEEGELPWTRRLM